MAVNTGFVDNGVLNARGVAFYKERSGHGLHCSIVGNVVIPNGFASNEVCAAISDHQSWSNLAKSISDEGALPGIQLSSAWAGYRGMRGFVQHHDGGLKQYLEMARSISTKDVRCALDGLHRGTDIAVRAGFRHIQLHAAHGYLFNLLLDQRLSTYFNVAIQEIEKWAVNLASANIESSIRISLWSGAPELDQEGTEGFIDAICSLPVNYVDASAGFYNIDKHLIYPSSAQIITRRVEATLKMATRHPNKRFILSGKSAHAWDDSLLANVHIGICRDLIANPNFMRDRSNGCRNHMNCHYNSRGERQLMCARWANSGHSTL